MTLKINHVFAILFLLVKAHLTYAQNPVADFTANDSLGCLPFSVSFFNNSSNAVSYFWDFGDGSTSTLPSPVNIYADAGLYTVSLISYNSDGSSDTLILPDYIQVVDTPSVNFTVQMDSICLGNDVADFVNNTVNGASYLWDFGDGQISSNQSPTHNYSQPGIYNVTLIAYNALGCSADLIKNNVITVLPTPNVSITSSLNQVCDTSSVITFSEVSNSNATIVWDFGNGDSDIGANVQYMFITEGEYWVTAEIQNEWGCVLEATLADSIRVSQTITPIYSISDTSGCPPLSVTLINETSNIQSVEWSFDGNLLLGDTVLYTFNTPGAKNFTMSVQDNNGCTTNTQLSSAVVVDDVPSVIFQLTDSSGCIPFTTSVLNSSDTTFQFQWNFSNGFQSNDFNPVFTHLTEQTLNVEVTVTDPQGCSTVNSYNDLVQVESIQPNISIENAEGCNPLTVNFSELEDNTVQWYWDFGDGTSSIQKEPNHTYDSAGVYTVQLVVYTAMGCVDTITFADTIKVFAPQYNYTAPDTIHSCNAMEVQLDGTSIGQGSWFWEFGDGTTSTNAAETHYYTEGGFYQVSLTTFDAYGCQMVIPNFAYYQLFDGEVGFAPNYTCLADLFSFTDTSSISATSWYWNFGDGTFDTIQHPIHQYANPGMYLVQLTIEGEQCTQSVNTMVTSLVCDDVTNGASPLASANPSAQSGDTILTLVTGADSINPYCAPYTINFSPPVNDVVNILWEFGDGTTSTDLNPSHTYYGSGTFDLNITCETIDSSYSFVSPSFLWLSSASSNYSITQENFCGGGGTVTFIPESTNDSIHWNFGDGTTEYSVQPVHNYSAEGNYFITNNLTNGYGCASSTTQSVVINQPNPLFTYQAVACIGEEIEFSANIDNYASYIWDFGDGSAATGEIASHSFQSAGSYHVSLIAIDNSGCPDTTFLPETIQIHDPVASFEISDSAGCESLVANFINTSQYADSWEWNFGDQSTSGLENGVHTYTSIGVYDVTLIASIGSCSDTAQLSNAVTIYEPVATSFSYTKQNSCFPVTLEFQNQTLNFQSSYWDFGDGLTDTIANPIHTFDVENATTITLHTVDSNGCSSSFSSIGVEAYHAEILVNSMEGCVPVYAQYSSISDSSDSWQWNFGDGSFSTDMNPFHTFNDTGSFQVSLISSSSEGCVDTAYASDLVVVEYLVADFYTSDSSSCAPSAITFQDQSTNADTWYWDFGDSTYSSLQNPSHVYLDPGDYEITLIAARSSYCSDTLVKSDYVKVLGPVASFEMSSIEGCDSMEVQFTNTSSSFISSEWYFGDGYFSYDTHPNHNYPDTGMFVATLVVTDSLGCTDYLVAEDTIHVYSTPEVSFSPSISQGCKPLSVSFTNTSLYGTSYEWDFGYGANSYLENASYTYNIAGTYYASLTVQNHGVCSSLYDSVEINVSPIPYVNFSADTSNHCFPALMEFSNLSGDTANSSFFWDFGTGDSSQTVSPQYNYQEMGEYTVSLSAVNMYNCTASVAKPSFVKLVDTIPPTPSHVNTISVLQGDRVFMGWTESTDADFYRYNVYFGSDNDSSLIRVDSLYGIQETKGGQGSLETSFTPYKVVIQTEDQCGNKLPLEQLIEFKTILLSATSKPNSRVELGWTPYEGAIPQSYTILRKYNDVVEQIATVGGDQLNYVDVDFKCQDEYTYAIIANSLDNSYYISRSNEVKVDVLNEKIENQTIEIVRSTVVDDSYILTEWKPPYDHPEMVVGYALQRSTNQTQGFETIQELPSFVTQYSDFDVDVKSERYYYQIEVQNICKTNLSNNLSSSILLKKYSDGQNVLLKWSAYEGWENGVEKYIIEKRVNGGEWEVIKEVPGDVLQIQDVIYVPE